MNEKVTIKGKDYEINISSPRRIKKLGDFLGVDLWKAGIQAIKWDDLIADEPKCLAAMNHIFAVPATDSILDDMTFADIVGLFDSFFIKGGMTSIQFSKELEPLVSIINRRALSVFLPQKDTASTLPSTTLQEATPDSSGGRGIT